MPAHAAPWAPATPLPPLNPPRHTGCESPSTLAEPHVPTLARPQLTIATAIVFYHRFYSRKSYDGYDRFRIATTCLFLAGKVEETPKKIKDVVIETYKAQHGAAGKASGPDPESKEFWSLKEEILVCERILLQTLDFDLTVEHAYRRAPLPRRPAVAPRHRRRPQTRPRSGPDSTDGPGPVAQAAARVREEHQGHARFGAGCVELYQRQPAHHHCSAGALPPRASRLPPPAVSAAARHTAPHRPHRSCVVRVRSTRRDVWRRRRSTWPLGSWTTRWCCPRITISRGARSPHTHTPELQPRF